MKYLEYGYLAFFFASAFAWGFTILPDVLPKAANIIWGVLFLAGFAFFQVREEIANRKARYDAAFQKGVESTKEQGIE